MFGGLLENRKLQLADINYLAIQVRSPRLLRESTQLAQYWRCDRKSANLPNIIPRQYSGYTVNNLCAAACDFIFACNNTSPLLYTCS